jgi:hypothetical protein
MAVSPKRTLRSSTGNRHKSGSGIVQAWHVADSLARAQVSRNRKLERPDRKNVLAAVAASDYANEFEIDTPGFLLRVGRWLLGLQLLPLCVVTTVTFFEQFSNATIGHRFWASTEFWYFATGVLMMCGWFFTKLLRNMFLYLYVLGHELTHILFILLCGGRIGDWKVSTEGGYVTTDKSNILIALAPYFVPLWATVGLVIYSIASLFWQIPPIWEKVLFGFTGFFWAFHFLWTLWMIPRDQPDLKENGTFLSLMIISLVNMLLLSMLLCIASANLSLATFFSVWLKNASKLFDLAQEGLKQLL